MGGNSKTTLVACITGASVSLGETISTLRFASRARLVKNCVSVNVSVANADINTLRSEVERLAKALESTRGCPFEFALMNQLQAANANLTAEISQLKQVLQKNRDYLSRKDKVHMNEKMVARLREREITRLNGLLSAVFDRDQVLHEIHADFQELKNASLNNDASTIPISAKLMEMEQELAYHKQLNSQMEGEVKGFRSIRDGWVGALLAWESERQELKERIAQLESGEAHSVMEATVAELKAAVSNVQCEKAALEARLEVCLRQHRLRWMKELL